MKLEDIPARFRIDHRKHFGLTDALERLKPDYRMIAGTKLKELEAARRALLGKRGR